jgi:hypothetical protein
VLSDSHLQLIEQVLSANRQLLLKRVDLASLQHLELSQRLGNRLHLLRLVGLVSLQR